MPIQAGHIYPLTDPSRYDDEFGAGYSFAVFPPDNELPDGCWLADAWIVNEAGEAHPGYNASPVPVHRDAVDETRGRPFSSDLPERQSPFAWLR